MDTFKLDYMMELRRLRLLRELARRGTVSAVADASSMTPSAVSQQLAALQREARTTLYVREGRRLRITDAGLLLVDHTERLLAGMEEAESALAELAATVTGPVRLSAFPTVARSLVPEAIAECQRRHPGLRVILDEREATQSIEALHNHETDLALVYEYGLLPPLDSPGITLRPLREERFVLLLPPGRELGPDAIPLTDLAEETWIGAYSDTSGRAALNRACAAADFQPRVDYASNDYTVIIALVRAGLGIALAPEIALEPGDTDIVVRHLADTPITRTISLATRAGTARSPALKAVANSLAVAAQGR
ncbi:LysR family transcriptional regulator [Spiractinospora alimapuensis]|uniref:LysR family transcriptional regulator n=1 Tax=Spiractinospora alimapuensis TaxID=2820884 RepID=UPI001F4067DE|nr:LysR family transcriptional regulator [Spiractinospora alimapuensis]QVQ50635.1 LysR family transcriptional regulator [Spiractinospora alimapuensis]